MYMARSQQHEFYIPTAKPTHQHWFNNTAASINVHGAVETTQTYHLTAKPHTIYNPPEKMWHSLGTGEVFSLLQYFWLGPGITPRGLNCYFKSSHINVRQGRH
jgi:hypothetical protein